MNPEASPAYVTVTKYAAQGPGGSIIERSGLDAARRWATDAGPQWRVVRQIVTRSPWERVADDDDS